MISNRPGSMRTLIPPRTRRPIPAITLALPTTPRASRMCPSVPIRDNRVRGRSSAMPHNLHDCFSYVSKRYSSGTRRRAERASGCPPKAARLRCRCDQNTGPPMSDDDDNLEYRFQNLHEFVKAARQNLDRNNWDYLIGASETETTLARNRMALDSIGF